MKLIDAPIGLFIFDGYFVLKTEYSSEHSTEDGIIITPDCYTVNGGEYFWGGAETVAERNNLEVIPVPAIGDTVYRICRVPHPGKKEAAFIRAVTLNQNNFWRVIIEGELGKTVFLTKDEAAEAMKET